MVGVGLDHHIWYARAVDPVTIGFLSLAVALPWSVVAIGLAGVTAWISRGRKVAELERNVATAVDAWGKQVLTLKASTEERLSVAESVFRTLQEEVADDHERAVTERRRATSIKGVQARAANAELEEEEPVPIDPSERRRYELEQVRKRLA